MSIILNEKSKINEQIETQQKGHRQRLYERLKISGYESLLDYEIVELMLFLVFKRIDTKPLAKILIKKFGTIDKILSASRRDLMEIEGLGEGTLKIFDIINAVMKSALKSKIIKRSTIDCFEDIIQFCKTNMKNLIAEEIRVIFLNGINEVVGDEILQRGTIDSVDITPREIVRKCIENGSKGFILVHNHPSGDPTPSVSDIHLTKRIKEAADIFNITLYDHIIIGGNRYISLRNLLILK